MEKKTNKIQGKQLHFGTNSFKTTLWAARKLGGEYKRFQGWQVVWNLSG